MPLVKYIAAVLSFVAALPLVAAEKPAKHNNRLAKESSPYLRQHAHNPVDWFPWGPEAFAKAKKENKLVFLSIGYSSCHWCHVMERESFANDSVAKILNENFVCIKVDREERPDIDEIYMTALHVFGQRGGWPLSMFLTSDAMPIIGGTYWPPEDREIQGETVKGFKSILQIMIDLKAKEPQKLTEQAEQVAKLTRQQLGSRGKAIVTLNRDLINDAIDEVSSGFDEEHGGYGQKRAKFRGTKFPMPTYLNLLLTEFKRSKSDDVHRQLTTTLTKMASGGIFDHLGGGFHRYSTERTWTVPHFEKMLYDNAQLVEVYSRMYEIDPNPLYVRAVRDTLAFVKRELTSPEGAFYSALDADSEGEEGRFYVWTAKTLEAALTPEELVLAREVYGESVNFEEKATILTRNADFDKIAAKRKMTPAALAAKLEPVRQKLFDVRAKRPRPFLDTKVLAAWNGQMIAGYAVAGRVMKDPGYVATAARAADFVLSKMRTKDGRLLRTYMNADGKAEARLNAYLDDYAFLVHGLLELQRATLDQRWLNAAIQMTEEMVKWFRDEKDGGFFFTSHDHEKLFARSKDQFDGAQPSGNSVAALNFVRLFKITESAKYRDLAKTNFETFAGTLKAEPNSMTTMLAALAEYLDVAGEAKGDEPKKPAGGARKSDAVVKVAATAEKPDAAGKQVVTVTLTIDDGWYVYANPVGNKDMESSETTVDVTGKGKPKVLKVEYPKGTTKKDKVLDVDIEYLIYEGKVTIKATVQRAADDTEPLEVTAKFGACNKRGVCLLPVTVKVPVK